MAEVTSPTKTKIESPLKSDSATKPQPIAMEKAIKDDVPSSDSVKPMSPTSTPDTNGVDKTPARRVYKDHKFDPATEEEIRSIMLHARNISHDNEINTETDIVKLATLTTNLIQLLNAEYIAKDAIVRAVAYMQGESHLSPYRALTQAHYDRRAARRNSHNGQHPRNVSNQENRARAVSDGAKKALGDVKEESTVADTPHKSDKPDADSTVIASPSQASSTGESIGNGTGSDKENTSPKSSGSKSTKAKKKNYWKSRREAKKAEKAAAGNVDKAGRNGRVVVTNGTAHPEGNTTDKKDSETATDRGKEASGERQEGVDVKA
ncbi:hypothetical protein LTR20_009991 [Exophiala xenobiotica]|nr:hypothetical protein LTS13_009410 [Exophiala xenobiotica]KAK5392150.1 hypothetical protein LTR79_010560 [Exophiala xenobiotica]KAK5407701.1 hypothetical protein LTR90_009877 [Exophiala xenobiotica]KAK5454752.1 hypothetical protein LTR20_009991 [Exophiala xenobiotica]KAK5498341.1 hypothetical protein LTR26_001742 [Exophiala xenobiotica]